MVIIVVIIGLGGNNINTLKIYQYLYDLYIYILYILIFFKKNQVLIKKQGLAPNSKPPTQTTSFV